MTFLAANNKRKSFNDSSSKIDKRVKWSASRDNEFYNVKITSSSSDRVFQRSVYYGVLIYKIQSAPGGKVLRGSDKIQFSQGSEGVFMQKAIG